MGLSTSRSRLAAGLGALAMCTAGLPILTSSPTSAATPTPCGNRVTALNAVSSDGFVNGGKIKRYNATVDFPNRTGFYDQSGRLVLGKYPTGSLPTLLNMPVGERNTIRTQVTSQQPKAIAAINGDFFVYRTIRGKAVEFARGPMVKNGAIIRSDKQQLRVVGVDSANKPFGGTLGVQGSIRIGQGPKTSLAGVNWDSVQARGVTLYTMSYSHSSNSPRPAGAGEWVINGRNKIVEIRTSSLNAGRRGLAVQSGTRVLAFPSTLASVAAAGAVGQRVRVRMSQATNTGVTLKTAVGRGAMLVKKGVAAPAGCAAYDYSAAARPRTIIGWTKTGAWRSLTIPGTNISGTSRTGGFGLANTAALAKKLGMRFAFELDGGASTTFYTRSAAGTWTRRDLFGVSGGTYERPVANGMAFLPPSPSKLPDSVSAIVNEPSASRSPRPTSWHRLARESDLATNNEAPAAVVAYPSSNEVGSRKRYCDISVGPSWGSLRASDGAVVGLQPSVSRKHEMSLTSFASMLSARTWPASTVVVPHLVQQLRGIADGAGLPFLMCSSLTLSKRCTGSLNSAHPQAFRLSGVLT